MHEGKIPSHTLPQYTFVDVPFVHFSYTLLTHPPHTLASPSPPLTHTSPTHTSPHRNLSHTSHTPSAHHTSPSLFLHTPLTPSPHTFPIAGENKPPGSVEGYSPKGKEGSSGTRASLSPKDKKLQASKYCWLCAFQFTMFKRQHHCRLCDASCCDDCCKKKGIIEGQQVMNTNYF